MKFYLPLSRFLFAVLVLVTLKSSAQMEAPHINHVAIYVYDLKKSTDFYKDIIRLTIIPEPFHDSKHTWFKIGEHSQLHIISGAVTIKEHDKNSHTCFSVSSVESFAAMLNKNNIPFENAKGIPDTITARTDGIKQIFFKDPDGYWIEINDDRY